MLTIKTKLTVMFEVYNSIVLLITGQHFLPTISTLFLCSYAFFFNLQKVKELSEVISFSLMILHFYFPIKSWAFWEPVF